LYPKKCLVCSRKERLKVRGGNINSIKLLKIVCAIALIFMSISAAVIFSLLFITSNLSDIINIPMINFIDLRFIAISTVMAFTLLIAGFVYKVREVI